MNLEEIKIEKFTDDLDKAMVEIANNTRIKPKKNSRIFEGFLKKFEELIKPSSEEKKG